MESTIHAVGTWKELATAYRATAQSEFAVLRAVNEFAHRILKQLKVEGEIRSRVPEDGPRYTLYSRLSGVLIW